MWLSVSVVVVVKWVSFTLDKSQSCKSNWRPFKCLLTHRVSKHRKSSVRLRYEDASKLFVQTCWSSVTGSPIQITTNTGVQCRLTGTTWPESLWPHLTSTCLDKHFWSILVNDLEQNTFSYSCFHELRPPCFSSLVESIFAQITSNFRKTCFTEGPKPYKKNYNNPARSHWERQILKLSSRGYLQLHQIGIPYYHLLSHNKYIENKSEQNFSKFGRKLGPSEMSNMMKFCCERANSEIIAEKQGARSSWKDPYKENQATRSFTHRQTHCVFWLTNWNQTSLFQSFQHRLVSSPPDACFFLVVTDVARTRTSPYQHHQISAGSE